MSWLWSCDWVCGSLGGTLIPQLHLTTLLRRLWLQTNLYCADSGSKLSFTQDGSGHTEMLWLHFSIVEGSGDASSIFFFLVYGCAGLEKRKSCFHAVKTRGARKKRLGSRRALWSCIETVLWTFDPLAAIEVHYNGEKFSPQNINFFSNEKERHASWDVFVIPLLLFWS